MLGATSGVSTGQSQSFAGKTPEETAGFSDGALMALTGDDIIASCWSETAYETSTCSGIRPCGLTRSGTFKGNWQRRQWYAWITRHPTRRRSTRPSKEDQGLCATWCSTA